VSAPRRLRRLLRDPSATAGLAVVGLLTAAGLLAPVLATDRPLAVRLEDGWRAPALEDLPVVGLLLPRTPTPPGGWERLLGEAEAPPALRAPIPHGPQRADLAAVLRPPGGDHPLGTDHGGYDLAARLVHGARVSLTVGLLAALLALGLGALLGGAAGLAGGTVDAALSRLIEVVATIPTLLLILAVQALDPPLLRPLPDIAQVVVILGVTQWTGIARLVRGEVLRLRESAFLAAARASGAGPGRLLVRHLLPSALPPAIVPAAFLAAGAILLEAALSFLGFGVQDLPSWGAVLAENREAIIYGGAWWMAIFPGGLIFLAVLGYNLLGEGLRDALDPRGTSRSAHFQR
jgi:peptide/nickel transport system permease protein